MVNDLLEKIKLNPILSINIKGLFFSPEGTLITDGLPENLKKIRGVVDYDLERNKGDQLWSICTTLEEYFELHEKAKAAAAEPAIREYFNSKYVSNPVLPWLKRADSDKFWNSSSGKV